jgi:hypothetical protein
MAACDTMHTNLFHSVYFMCAVVVAAMVTTPNLVLALSKSSDHTNNNNNNTRDWNFYRANIHNLAVLNDTGTLKDCSTTGQIGPCWDSSYQTFVP